RGPARWVAYRVLRGTPVERCPAFYADLLGVKVPRSVRPLPAKRPEGGSNINILFELLGRAASVPGDVAECGVFRGASLLGLGLFVRQRRLGKLVRGFDSFEGFDADVEIDLRLGGRHDEDKKVGGFANTSDAAIGRKVAGLGLEDVVRLHKGYFRGTL